MVVYENSWIENRKFSLLLTNDKKSAQVKIVTFPLIVLHWLYMQIQSFQQLYYPSFWYIALNTLEINFLSLTMRKSNLVTPLISFNSGALFIWFRCECTFRKGYYLSCARGELSLLNPIGVRNGVCSVHLSGDNLPKEGSYFNGKIHSILSLKFVIKIVTVHLYKSWAVTYVSLDN